MTKAIRYATCHPEEKHHCKGLCRRCYDLSRPKLSPEKKKIARHRSKMWRLNNLERSKNTDRNKHYLRKFNITLEQYNQLLKDQNGVCKLCQKPEQIKIRGILSNLAVDHCHETGKVRGLLCFKCNTSISQIESIENYLETLCVYLEKNDEKEQQ